jgi:hypothetical protein
MDKKADDYKLTSSSPARASMIIQHHFLNVFSSHLANAALATSLL